MRALALLLCIAACGDNLADTDPFHGLKLDHEITDKNLSAPVHVARDKYGVAHISGQTVGDVAFAQGYVMAHDRLPQMDILRRFGAGTLGELFGALDPSVIDTDLEMRVHRMKPLAEMTWATLQASTDPTDQQIVALLQRFADGVNAYATDLQAGKYDIDPNLLVSFDPARFVAWSPVDSLVLGRFQAFALSWSTPFEVDLTDLYQKLRTKFDAAAMTSPADYARRGISKDLLWIQPVGMDPTIPGFPNVDTDTGTRSDAGRTRAKHHTGTASAAGPRRPEVPQAVLDSAKKFLGIDIHDGPFGSYGPHAFMRPWAGSNNWAVGPSIANGKALLATDQHLQLPNPSIFYPTHIIVKDNVDVLGVTFPGIPGVILGSNSHLAWAATVSEHDVNDVYLENITPCGGGSCVAFNGQQVPITTFTEHIQIGALGTITSSVDATYEVVPHHGPIIPVIANHKIVPRTAAQAMSVKYTGYEPTFEIRALWNLGHAKTVDEGFKALADFTYGSQNWTMIADNQDIAWTTNAYVPWRDPRAYQWNATTNPDGLAPFFVLPGDGTAEWQGRMDSRYVPHAINPAQGYLATANADPVGATFDNDPLNQQVVDGRPLYAGVTYAPGLRESRITELIKATGSSATLDDMARIQHDTHSNSGSHIAPAIVAALAKVDDPSGAPSDVATYVAGLSAADKASLDQAKQILSTWTYETPTAIDAPSNDSSATALFNMWMHFFLVDAMWDEYAAVSFDTGRLDDNQLVRVVYGMLTNPSAFVLSQTTQQPIVCDRYPVSGPDDSCTKMVMIAMLDALHQLAQPDSFGSANPADWRWGKLHTLTLKPLFPNHALDVGPFPKAGDNFVINRADQGWDDTNFSQFGDGPAQRFLAEAAPGQPITVKWALPGGTIYDSRSPHYRDLLDNYYLPMTHFDAPYTVPEIVAAGESRWDFHH
ncbi:MAG: penicillin acylase family protein [Deltaproteobacteria bacterium]|nr:penicillin acylase family protein [Deltaproteobacteria bacterium]